MTNMQSAPQRIAGSAEAGIAALDVVWADEFNADQYRVTAAIEINAILRSMAADNVIVTVYYAGLEHFVLTRILAVNPDYAEIVFDGVRNPAVAAALETAETLTVHAYHHQIKIIFKSGPAKLATNDGMPAFRVGLPGSLVRLQRRSDYRARAPVLAAATLTVNLGGQDAPGVFRIADVSCGGLAFTIAPGKTSFAVGDTLRNCILDLPRVSQLHVSLEICHVCDYTDGLGHPMRRCGCRFLRLPGALATLVQRYINQVDVDRRKLAGGL